MESLYIFPEMGDWQRAYDQAHAKTRRREDAKARRREKMGRNGIEEADLKPALGHITYFINDSVPFRPFAFFAASRE